MSGSDSKTQPQESTLARAASVCLHERIDAQAELQPNATALSCGDQKLSWSELAAQSSQLAAALVNAGVTTDSPVGLCLNRSVDLIVALVGILKAGGAYVPLDPAYPPDRLAHILDQAAPAIIVGESALRSALPDNDASFFAIDGPENRPVNAALPKVSPTSLCYVIFTSGSTGLPKGVMVSHHNVVRLFDQIDERITFNQDDVWTLFHSYAFGFSAWEIFGALLHGSRLVIIPEMQRTDPPSLYELLKKESVTVFSQTPSAFRQTLLHEAFANSDAELKLRKVVLSGEAVAENDLQSWQKLHSGSHSPQLFNTYAITETGGQVAVRSYSGDAAENGTKATANIGLPLADTPVWILDEHLQALPDNQAGELCVGGPGLARGYIGDSELTEQRFIDIALPEGRQRIYRTGDRAQRLSNGEIEFLGRTDNQVKVRGYRVELGDIETAVASHPAVAECACVLNTELSGDPRLIAYVVSGSAPTIIELREHVAKSLPDYMVPALFVLIKALPLNANGKLDRGALPSPGSERPDLGVPYTAPAGLLEQKLTAIWSEVLGIDGLGTQDNFFALGGDSILALKLTSALRGLLGEHVFISALIDAPNIGLLATHLRAEFPAATAALEQPGGSHTPAEQLPAVVPRHAERFDVFPLTDIQQAYLVGRGTDFAMGNVSTHLYIEVDATALDLPRLERAWQKVIDRHPMLRAIVLADGTQRILETTPPYKFPVQNLRNLSADTVESGLMAERERLSHQVIPSDRWPLFELSASVMPADKTRIHISLDCLITDARSFQIMSSELLTFYNDPDAQLPLPGLSFRDYVLAEHKVRETGLYKRALEYWQTRLKTLPPMPALPLARAPETLEHHRFMQRGQELGKADWERFQNRAIAAGVTPTAALLQCFGETLAAWSRSTRLTLNLTLFNRMPLHPDVDNVVGDFTSLVLLGVEDLASGGFEQRAQRLQKELWRGVDSRFVSGVQVMREMSRMGGPIQPMMPIVFTSTLGIGAGGQDSSSWHLLGEQVYSVSQTPQVWIDHVASERDGALWYTWDVVEELFPDGMIDALFAAYADRLLTLASDEQSWEASWPEVLDTILPADQASLRLACNATTAPEPTELLHAGFMRQTALTPELPAVIATDRTLSYRELDSMSNRLAQQLTERGVATNELIAVVMQKGWEQIVAVLGILKSGAAYMPVDASMPTERLHYLLDFGQVRIAVTQVCQDDAIEWPDGIERLRISDDALANAADTPCTHSTALDDIAYVIFTSGSTGQPKGVVIDHRGAANTCIDVNQRFKVGEHDRILALSSLSFDLSVYDIFGLLATGGALVLPDAAGMRDPAHWATLVAQHRVTIWNTVPALMDLLTDYAEGQTEPVLDSLRVVMMSGDWIPVRLPDRIRALGTIDVYSLGGATEASIWSIIYPISKVPENWTSIPYGTAMLNQSFHVLNEELAPCPAWVPGELFIGGIGLAKGYWRDEEKTAASFITHPRTGERLYRTGDLGRFLPDGNIEFLGREDFQVKVQGFRVELGDIEAALESHAAVRSAVVVAAGDGRQNVRLVAYCVATTPQSDTELRTWIAKKLPEYMIPGTFVMLDELPLTANGKVDRQRLPEPPSMDQSARQSSNNTMSAENAPATRITQLVAEVLNTDTLEANANLLQLGATSIEMIRIANALDQNLGFRPRMDDFYRDPSINGLAEIFSRHGMTAPAAAAAVGGDPLGTPEWLLAGVDKIMDPDERNAFKQARPGVRKFSSKEKTVALPAAPIAAEAYRQHRSYREFSQELLSPAQIAAMLNNLRSIELENKPKYLYGSAGGLYPVQCYVYVKPERITDVDAGFYYHDPEQHSLVALGGEDSTLRDLYDPLINRPIFDSAAFAIFLVADLAAIASLYRERALHYATLETGHITQLLEMRAMDDGLALCQTGGVETAELKQRLQLSAHHLVLHGLLGGGLPSPGADSAAASSTQNATDNDDRDEGEL